MALIFERIHTGDIAELSYLVGDDSEVVAAVIDPRADVDCYLDLAREKQLSIMHIFETHIHADLVSGARELCARVETAKIFVSHEGGARYGFDYEKIQAGDTFKLGAVLITVRHTPGHTPEHVAYSLAEKDHPDAPSGVLTGDSLCQFRRAAGPPRQCPGEKAGGTTVSYLARFLPEARRWRDRRDVAHPAGHGICAVRRFAAARLNFMPAKSKPKPKPKPKRPKAPRRRPGPPTPSPGPYNPHPPKRPGLARK